MKKAEKVIKLLKIKNKLINDYQEEHEILLDEIRALKKENRLLKSRDYYVRLYKHLKQEEKLRGLLIIINPKNKELATSTKQH